MIGDAHLARIPKFPIEFFSFYAVKDVKIDCLPTFATAFGMRNEFSLLLIVYKKTLGDV